MWPGRGSSRSLVGRAVPVRPFVDSWVRTDPGFIWTCHIALFLSDPQSLPKGLVTAWFCGSGKMALPLRASRIHLALFTFAH